MTVSNSKLRVRTFASLKFSKGAIVEKKIFTRDNFLFDWSECTKSSGYSYAIKNTDSVVVNIEDDISATHLYIATDAPVVIEYRQDDETRRFTVSPSVQPIDYFTTPKTPGDAPRWFKRGILVLNGSEISSLTIKGISTVTVVANVVINYAGSLGEIMAKFYQTIQSPVGTSLTQRSKLAFLNSDFTVEDDPLNDATKVKLVNVPAIVGPGLTFDGTTLSNDLAATTAVRQTLVADASDITIPIADAEGNGWLHVRGWIKGDPALSAVSYRFNGIATNCVFQRTLAVDNGLSAARDQMFIADGSGTSFGLVMQTQKGAGHTRMGWGWAVVDANQALWTFGLFWHDSATVPTSFGLHSGVVNGFKASSYVTFWESKF